MARGISKKSSSSNNNAIMNSILIAIIVIMGAYIITTSLPVTQQHAMHTHVMMDVPSENAPTVDLIVTEDPKAGYNLQILTENFEFAPERASTDHIEGQGHAHVYVDDVKINRVYGEWYHIPSLEPGEHQIKVTLSTNNHKDISVDGKMVVDIETIMVE